MEQIHQSIITRYCPREEIFRGEMTFTEARRFMSENATYERRVGFEVFNEAAGRWEKFNYIAYHGGRKVYDNGDLYILDPDYRSMWKPEDQQWHLWCITPDGRKVSALFRGIYHRLCSKEHGHQIGHVISHCSDWWGDGTGDMLFIREEYVEAFEQWAKLGKIWKFGMQQLKK